MAIQFKPDQAILMVVDMQEKLLPLIHDWERVVARATVLIRAARLLGLPIVWTEQYRKGLGPSVPEIAEAIGDAAQPREKLAFGCLGDEAICGVAAQYAQAGRRQMVLCGIETHVCILQTALKGIEDGYTIFLAEDALGSRRAGDRESALRRLAQAGAVPASVEMLIMEALGVAGGEKFKAILPLLREM
jgi:nicotinamidase-related amidase